MKSKTPGLNGGKISGLLQMSLCLFQWVFWQSLEQ
jgi:hypothetical protein